LVLDLDGVVYRGPEPVPGAADAIERARAAGVKVVFCTNNALRTVSQYVERLASVGIEVAPDEIVTSAVVTGEVLADRGFAGRSAIVVGGEGVRHAVSEAGVTEVTGDRADIVIVGLDREFTYEKMRRATSAIRAGAALIATNSDTTFPAPEGLWPGAGAILASIEAASGRSAEVLGKPHRPMMEVAARRLSPGSGAVAMVGDRDDTDLVGARSMGWLTVLVLSGVTGTAEARRLDPQPDVILSSLADLDVGALSTAIPAPTRASGGGGGRREET
jgi:4-nitrophenyl phosphatase